MTGGEAVHRVLVEAGVEHVFGVVSVHNLPIYDAIDRGGRITPVAMRHEQAAAHAADGYARATGKLGVVITSTGPGAANAVPGLYEAGFASSPVLMITAQVDTPYLGKGLGFLHEAEQQAVMLSAVSRRVESVRLGRRIAPALGAVIEDILTGRPQPGCVEIPIDLQYAAVEGTPDGTGTTGGGAAGGSLPAPLPPEPEAARRAARMLARAVRPLIIAGGGVLRSGGAARSGGGAPELRALAERLQAPVLSSPNGRGALPEDHPLSIGALPYHAEIQALQEEADVVLAVGTRFQVGPEGRNYVPLRGELIHLDADAGVIGRVHRPALALVADAAAGLAAINAALEGNVAGDGSQTDATQQPDTAAEADQAAAHAEWAARASAARTTVHERLRESIGPDHAAIMELIRAGAPRDAMMVRDSTVPAYLWGNQMLPILAPRTSLHPTSAAIGPGLPLAIGAALGSGRRSVLIAGDGGFMLHAGELSAAVQYRLPLTICLFNDRGYGILRRVQAARFAGRTFAVDLETPDFPALARSMGAAAHAVASVEQFAEAYAAAQASTGPVLLDIDLNALHPMGEYPPRRRF